MKPLQTHNHYIETWIPPHDRFTRFELSDEDWARPLGFGHVKRQLAKLFDVRDEYDDLVGYTSWNPAESDRWVHIPVMSSIPARIALDHMDSAAEVCPTFKHITARVQVFRVASEGEFVCWQIDLKDAEALARCKWLTCLGEDQIHRFVYELRRKLWERGQRAFFQRGGWRHELDKTCECGKPAAYNTKTQRYCGACDDCMPF